MASFPTSAKSFAARSNGQTIDAAHVGDLQDEVNAIEDGYLNGSARLNSSGSTMVSLSVTGGSTFSSRVTFHALPYVMPSSGGSTGEVLTIVSTSGSTMGVEWRASGAGAPEAVRVSLDDALVIAQDSTAAISWTQQTFVTNSSMHSTTTNSSRLTPQSTGVYLCSAQFLSLGGASTRVEAWIKDSSGGFVAFAEVRAAAAAEHAFALSGLKRFDVVGGFVTAAFDPRSSTDSISSGAQAYFSIAKL